MGINLLKKVFLISCVALLMFSCFDSDLEKLSGYDETPASADDTKKVPTDSGEKGCSIGHVVYSAEHCARMGTSWGQSAQIRKKVDIAFVLDVGDSMRNYISRLFLERFKNFISTMSDGLDWRWFYLQSDYGESFFPWRTDKKGQFLKLEGPNGIMQSPHILSSSTGDAARVFMHSITSRSEDDCSNPPYCEDFSHRPLTALKASFQNNQDLIKSTADFVAVIITNRDEPSKEVEADATSAEEVVMAFNQTYLHNKKRFFAINLIIQPGDQACLKENQDMIPSSSVRTLVREAVNVDQLAQQTGGSSLSICLEDYSVVAKRILDLVFQQPSSTE